MVTISLCMIVKNEAHQLSRCLDSYAGISDEIIIVDTGSDDNTKEIAAKYTDKIFDFKWNGDFSQARNFAFSKTSCDYIFSADADEYLDDANRKAFSDLKTVLMPEIEIVQMKYLNVSEYNTVYNSIQEYRPKLFKRLRTFKWISPVHETIKLDPVVFDSDIIICHCPDSDHSKRDFSTFINAINNGAVLEDYAVIMFCKELFISGTDNDFLNVSDIFENKLSKEIHNDDCTRNISCVLARIYRLKKDYNNFFKICLKDVAINPCAEICMELGSYFYDNNDYEEAVLWYINASSETESIIDIHSSGDAPLYCLSECYSKLAAIEKNNGNYDLYNVYLSNSSEYKKQAEEFTLPEEI